MKQILFISNLGEHFFVSRNVTTGHVVLFFFFKEEDQWYIIGRATCLLNSRGRMLYDLSRQTARKSDSW